MSVDEFLNAHFQRAESYPFFKVPEANADEVLDEQKGALSAKVFLHPSPACADMWREARELIPKGTEKEFLIMYVLRLT